MSIMHRLTEALSQCREDGIGFIPFAVSRALVRLYRLAARDAGPSVSHLFFHSLAVDPELAFRTGNDSAHDFESWFVSVSEFKAILERLHERGYMLVRMRDAAKGELHLPQGKKPVVLSFDDVNYYDYMKGYGFAGRMVITGDGQIACTYQDRDGSVSTSTEADCVPLLEAFIREHPDFSHDGARGIIAVTGYEGVLGYRSPESEADALREVVNGLKARGWEFASHSWGHHHRAWSSRTVVAKKAWKDIRRWEAEVEPYVGKTDMFITPFGVDTRRNPLVDLFLRWKGFRFFFSVGNGHDAAKIAGAMYFSRMAVDGITLMKYHHRMFPFTGNPSGFLCPARTRDYPVTRLTAEGLVRHAEACLAAETVYLWDGRGEILTGELIDRLRAAYPDVFDTARTARLKALCGKGVRGFDCSGLVKNYVMGGLEGYRYVPEMDLNTSALIQLAQKKGPAAVLPEKPGLCLWMKGHTGIYAGNGMVIESTPNPKFGDGVVRTAISDREWELWYEFPWIRYD